VEAAEEACVRFNLRTGSLAALGLVGILLPAAAGVWAVDRFGDALTARIEEGQLAAARSIASEVHQSLDFSLDFTRAAAHRPGLVAWTRDHESTSLVRVLTNIYDTTPLYGRIAVFDTAGRLVGRVPERGDPPPLGNTAEAISSARITDAAAYLAVREPVSDPKGPTVGTLVAEIALGKLFPGVRSFSSGKTGRATLVDAENRVLVTGEAERLNTTLAAPQLREFSTSRKAGTARYLSRTVGRREVAAFAPAQDQGWGVLVTQAESEAFSSLAATRRVMIVGLIVLLGTAAVIAVAVSRAIGRYDQRVNNQLREQKRLNEALDQFAGRIAHDLRNPLSAVTAASEVLARDRERLSDHGRVGLDVVQRQSGRMIDLTDGLLRLARASGTPQAHPVDVRGIVEEAARDMRGLRVHLGDMPERIVADQTALSQVVGNLFQNAVRYGANDGCADVDVDGESSENGWVIRVSDRGPGIPPDEAVHLFEPFTRGSTAGNQPGSGLGLAIVAAAVRAHGGRASYAPREGGGSTFSLFIPAPPAA
jgi:signal transduction histidine kinase